MEWGSSFNFKSNNLGFSCTGQHLLPEEESEKSQVSNGSYHKIEDPEEKQMIPAPF
jgi:hypothetical protein